MKRWFRLVMVLTVVHLLLACNLAPQSATPDQVLDTLVGQLNKVLVGVAADEETPDSRTTVNNLDLQQAIALALENNLDYRVARFQQALAQSEMSHTAFGMLPRLALDAGYNYRDRQRPGFSESSLTGQVSLQSSISQDQEIKTYDYQLIWNTLDFAVGYFRTRQQGYARLGADENSRKVAHTIIQDVIYAYWQAYAAQQLKPEIDQAIADIRKALAAYRKMAETGVANPVVSLESQRYLISSLQQLYGKQREIAAAKTRLHAVLGIPLGEKFQLTDAAALQLPELDLPLASLQKAALVLRPEVRREIYSLESDKLESKVLYAQLFPRLNFNAGWHYDSNSYQEEDKWGDTGLSLSWGLINLASYPAKKAVAQNRQRLAEARVQAIGMAVLSQTEIAWKNYQAARNTWCTARQIADIDQDRMEHNLSRLKTGAYSRIQAIESRMENIISQLNKAYYFAELQSAYGMLVTSVGIDPRMIFSSKLHDAVDEDSGKADSLAKEADDGSTDHEIAAGETAPDETAELIENAGEPVSSEGLADQTSVSIHEEAGLSGQLSALLDGLTTEVPDHWLSHDSREETVLGEECLLTGE